MADFSTPLPQAAGAAASQSDSTGGLVAMLKSVANKDLWMGLGVKVLALSKSFFNPAEFGRPASQADWIARVSSNAKRFSEAQTLI